jgi:hypothetical protein
MIVTLWLPLLAALVVELSRRRFRPAVDERAEDAAAAPAWSWHAVRAATLGLAALWFAGTPLLGSQAQLLEADADGHALVAQVLASGRAPHGWIDAIGSGFPLGHHYPPLGWGVLAGLIELGLSPARAISVVGLFAWLVPPLVVIEASRIQRFRPTSALLGALFVLAVEPYAPYVGGWPVIARKGLVSQGLGVAFAAVWIGAVLSTRVAYGRRIAGVAAVLLVATHPQVFAAALAALAFATVAAWDRPLIERVALSAVPAGLVGVVIYGPGLRALGAPFGWPPDMGWLHAGVPPDRVIAFVEGDLVDYGQAPVLTALWIFGLSVALLHARRAAAARGVVAASVGVMLLAVSGDWIGQQGAVGRAVMTVFQPLRMLSVLPLVGAATVVVAVELLHRSVLATGRLRYAPLVVVALLMPEVLARAAIVRGTFAAFRPLSVQRTCTVDGQDVPIDEDLGARLRGLRGGRLAMVLPRPALLCARALGLGLDVGVPQAQTTAVGAHVGVTWDAFGRLERGTALGDAEALGVRWVLTRASLVPPPSFRVVWTRGPLALLERTTGSDFVGAACVREAWSGRESDLSAAIFDALGRPGELLGDPSRVAALVPADAGLVRTPVADACDARDARIDEVVREPGAVEARVESPAPFDAVLRVSASPAWRVELDGAEVASRRVAPGFLSVRVPAGKHHVEAVVSLAGYLWSAAIAAAFVPLGAVIGALSRAASRTRPWSRPRRRSRRSTS